MIVGCLGDSNTRFGTPPGGYQNAGPGTTDVWPEFAPAEPGGSAHTWLNFALGGGEVNATPGLWCAPDQRQRAALSGCTVLIAAFGTNDFRVSARPRDEIIGGYCRLLGDVTVPVCVCLTPDCTDIAGAHDAFVALNSRLLALGRSGWKLVDFWTDSTAALTDGVHLSAAHQHVRAQRVIAALALL